MSQTKSSVSEKQDNPLVLIKYDPTNAPMILSTNAMKTLAKVQGVNGITNVRQLESASAIISDAQVTADEVERFCDTLRAAVQSEAEKFRVFTGMEDFAANLTITRWSLRQRIKDGIAELKKWRANFLAQEQEKTRREQLAKQAEQDRINKEAADKAAKEAKKQGADKQTVADIRENVLATPAPIVTSKAAEAAQSVGASVRYGYSAQITDLKKFLGLCINNPVFLNTLQGAVPDIEAQFRKMASDQKEAFDYDGIRYKRTAIDVGRRA